MKVFKRSLAVILALCMMLGVVPFTAFASENTSAYSTGSTEFMRVFHLDCGRKYFTVDQIKELIDAISAAHYTHMELAIGNDGLRFLLDDMSVTANNINYSSADVTAGVKAGNTAYSASKGYYPGDKAELTQSEMDEIIKYADSKNIEIIPLVNTPGHMDAILAAMSACGISGAYNGSARTVDITNASAVAFTKALLAKYMDYFAGKGCTYFNIGADEYANDVYTSGGMGWAHLISVQLYDEFITYINGLVDMATARKLKPIAFNDGIYYNENTSSGTFSTDLIVSAWTAGWGSFNVASVDFLAGKGHKILNTNDAWYYVLGRASGSYGYSGAVSNSASVPVTKTVGNSSATPIGAMQCVWCDEPYVDYSSYKNNVMNLITTLSSNNTGYFKEEAKTVTDSATSVSVTAVGLGEVTVEAVDVPAIEGAEEVKAYNITPADYTGSAVVSIPVPAVWNNVRGGVMTSANGEQVLGITGTLANGVFTFEVPHFSTVVVYEVAPAAVTETVNVTVEVNGTYTHTDNSDYYTSYEGLNTAIATVVLGGSDGTKTEVAFKEVTISYRNLLNSNKNQEQTDYYVNVDGEYYPLYVTRSSNTSWGTTYYSYTYFYDNGVKLVECGSNSRITNTYSNVTGVDIYEPGDTVTIPAHTTITFTGVKEGTTSVQVGNTLYNVTVVAEDLSKVEPVQVEWWITNIGVTATDGTVADGKTSSGVSYSEITAQEAYGVNGVELADFVPATAKWGEYSLELWKGTRLLAENYQTTAGGDDETGSGDDFYYIRYYEGKWSVSFDRVTWLNVNDTDQLVAYYLQKQQITPEIDILFKDWGFAPGEGDNSANQVALSVAVVYPDGTLSPSESRIYPDTSVMFNYWEDRNIGIVAPQNNSIYNISKITVTDGRRTSGTSKTWPANATITWEKVTNEAGSQWYDERTVWDAEEGGTPMVNGAADNVIWPNGNTAILVLIYLEPVHYENNLKVQWVDDNAQESIIHEIEVNVSSDNEQTNFYDELKQKSALPAEGTGGTFILDDDAYVTNTSNVNQTFNKDITVMHDVAAQYKSGLYMYVGAELNADGTVLTLHYNVNPKKLAPMYVIDFGLKIKFPVTDLVKNPEEIQSLEITEAPIYGTAEMSSSDKDGIITYTPTRILQAIDVIRIDVTFVNGEKATVRVGIAPATTVYYEEGFLFTNGKASGSWTYMQGEEPLTAPNMGSGTHQQTAELGEIATNTAIYNYGYDPVYAGDKAGSDGTYAEAPASDKATHSGASTSFTFTGTGFELYANSKEATGIVSVLNKSNKLTKLYRIDTKLMDGDTGITTYADGDATEDKTYYSLPIISETDLEHGEYTVTIKQNNGENGALYIDGVRIINTVDQTGKTGANNIYFADKEDSPEFFELRDFVLKAIGVEGITTSDYISNDNRDGKVAAVKDMAGQVYNSLTVDNVEDTDTITSASAVIINKYDKYENKDDGFADSTGKVITNEQIQDLLDNGPKNELYLKVYDVKNEDGSTTTVNQSLTFKVTTNRVMQLGLKAPTGSAEFTLKVNGSDVEVKKTETDTSVLNSLTSTVDMFYEIAGKPQDGAEKEYTVTITVNSGLLSVTKLKICDDPNAAFVALTQEDIENALLGIYGLTDDKTPVEPEEPAAEADAVLAITLTDGKKEMGTAELTAVGAEGEKHTFTAEEILNAVLDAMPDLYKVSDESAITDVAVKYGETGELTVDIELEFEFDMDSWWRQVRTLMNRIFTIIADAGNGGSITNEGSADVKFRKDITYTITPDEGYEIESVIVDGKDVGAVSEYTFRRVRNDHRISVTFKEVQ